MKKWFIKDKNGKIISESTINWGNVTNEINEIENLSFDNNGQIIFLPSNMEKYTQGKTASSFIGSKNIEIESRYIGFIYKNIEIKIRIDEKTNNISVDVK